MVQNTVYTCANVKMKLPGMGGKGIKENDGGGELSYHVLDIL
jgi:hypothetical protein